MLVVPAARRVRLVAGRVVRMVVVRFVLHTPPQYPRGVNPARSGHCLDLPSLRFGAEPLARLEQARDDGQRNERADEVHDRPAARARTSRERVCDRQRAKGHDGVDEVEDLTGATAPRKQPKSAGDGHEERDDDDLLDAFGELAARHATCGAPSCLEAHEQHEGDAGDREPAMQFGRDGRSPDGSSARRLSPLRRSAFCTTPTMRTSQKMPIATNAQPRLRQSNAAAVLSGSCSPRSTNGITSRAPSISTIPTMVPQMSGSIPSFAPTNTFMPWVQLIGKVGL